MHKVIGCLILVLTLTASAEITDIEFTTSGYIEVFAPDGTYISRHSKVDEARESALKHAINVLDGEGNYEYTFKSPETRMSVVIAAPSGGGGSDLDILPPAAPTGVFLSDQQAAQVQVNWALGPENDIQDYRIYKSTTNSTSGFTLLGVRTYPNQLYVDTTFLSTEDSWYRVTARDNANPQNESEFSSTVSYSAPAVGEPYDLTAGGTRTVPFAYSWPTTPVTTNTVNVSSASAFNAAAAVDGTRINVTSSFSGNVTILGDDIDVVMANNLTITGRLTIGSFSSGARLNRFRWTGGNFTSGSFLVFASNDLMFNDVYFGTDANLASEGLNDFRGNNSNSGIAGVDRLAFVNVTINHINGSSTGDYAFYMASRNNSSDIIMANVKLRAQGQTHRVIQLTRYIVVDSVVNDDGGASSAFRIHGDGGTPSNQVYMADSMVRGTFKMDGTASSQGAQIANGVFERVTRYANDGFWAYTEELASGNDATINDSPLYHVGADGVSEAGLGTGITGSNNIDTPWDGSTVPDYSNVGAVR